MAILAIDIGGSAIKHGIWLQEELVAKGQFPAPKNWPDLREQLLVLKNTYRDRHSLEGVAISSPGAVNKKTGCIEGASALPYLHHFPIHQELTEVLALPISIENDANCAALAEVAKGAAKDCQDVLFVVVGTGIGGSVIVNRKIQHGKHLFGGEFGYMLLNETQSFSELGTAVNMARRLAKRKGLAEDTLTGKEAFKLANEGDLDAIEEVEAFYFHLAQGLYNLQYAFDPEKIIIGGGVSAYEPLLPNIRRHLKKILEQMEIAPFMPEIEVCHFNNDANLIGAIADFEATYQ
ncbi:ROK family protein [Isobaculum melis]|uniref:Sugar kinase of the NBD/HSP70 family, may contain an N-terminal HTH domain n=1 Tax=Isobaculum melis TaxID=142588 RepID=A0A1H9SDA8_9LACT|nr:ROK family protein [Isobaculum melis]SER82179.1 hypothetical protein SAMN04488559_1075 [Isobaculum melis]